jgi:hypothetical protein
MKKLLTFLFILSVGVIFFTACRKYEEGPNISLRTKKARVTNNWRVESAEVNGVERSQEPYWTKQKHYFRRNGDYVVTVIDPNTLEATNLNGSWKLYDNDRKIALTLRRANAGQDSVSDYNVLKLFNKQMWLRRTDNSVELHFIESE